MGLRLSEKRSRLFVSVCGRKRKEKKKRWGDKGMKKEREKDRETEKERDIERAK